MFDLSVLAYRDGEPVALAVEREDGVVRLRTAGLVVSLHLDPFRLDVHRPDGSPVVETAQDEHETEMKQMSGMGHDHATGVHVEAGQSKLLTVTFSTAGTFVMGCHEPGHWGAGMKGTIVVEA